MDEIALLAAFFNHTWLLYEVYPQRSALLQLRDDDGDIATLEDASYELIYNQQEKGRTSSYFAYGDLSLDSWGGYPAYRLNNAYKQLGLSNADDSGNIYLIARYDNISSKPNPRLILPTRETSVGWNFLKSTYINPKNNNGNDWPIAPIKTDTSLTSTYASSPELPTEIFDGYKSGVNSTDEPNYDTSIETWLIPVSLYFNRVDPKLAIQGQAKEGQTLTSSLTGIAAGATVSYVWQEQKQNSWSDLAMARSDSLFIPRNGSWTGKTVRLLATVTRNGRHQDLASKPLLIASGLDSSYGVMLRPNKSSYNEGEELSVAFRAPKSLTKTAKKTLYWAIAPQDSEGRTDANNNLDASDFSGLSNLAGSFTLPRSATQSSVSLSLDLDRRSELSESFRVELYANKARTLLLNQSALVTVIDSSNRRTATSEVDSLTGITDYSDTFVLPDLNSSRLGTPKHPTYDTITNFESIDRIIVNGQSNGLRLSIAAALTGLTTVPVTRITAADLNRALTPTDFPARSSRLLQVLGMESGSFLAINDRQAGFNASTDALIFLPGYLPGLPS